MRATITTNQQQQLETTLSLFHNALKKSEYDQEIHVPQLHTADQPTTP